MKLIAIMIVLLIGSTLALSPLQQVQHYFSMSSDKKQAIGQLIDQLGHKIIEYQQLAADGRSLLGFERQLGLFWQNPVSCEVCKAGFTATDFMINRDFLRNGLEYIISTVWSKYMEFEVCSGAVKEMGDVILPQLTDFILSPHYGCSRLFGFCKTPEYKTLRAQDFIDKILADKPDFLKNNDFINKEYLKIDEDKTKRKTVKVLHVTDLHLDFDYEEGSNAHWDEPLCCRRHNGPAPKSEDAAGKYGTPASCDLPPITAELMFKYIGNMTEQPDLLFWTGDNIAHDIWNQTAHKNAEYTIKITEWMDKHLKGMPVFPSPGNHEFFPVNVMRFEGGHPILDQLSEVWKSWLDEESYNNFKKYGYYSMPLKGVKESWNGYRVISLNTEACNAQNWYLFSQMNDPGNHLAWLEEEFKKMDQNGEKAYIIGHVQPGGGSWLYEWSVRYRALIERYQHLVINHLFGHSHGEFFNVFTDTKNSSAINVLHGPGSVTTYSNHFPMFRIYDIDYETGYPVKAHKYWFNLTQANLGDPKWDYAYELTEEYELKDLSPESFKNLSIRFKTDENMATQYQWNGGARQDSRDHHQCTSEGCKHGLYCSTGNIIDFERKDWNGSPRIDFNNDLADSFYNVFFDPWIEKM